MVDIQKNLILITGCAGFIGFHLTKRLLKLGVPVIGVDNMNSYYSVKLKEDRLQHLTQISGKRGNIFKFNRQNIESMQEMEKIFLCSGDEIQLTDRSIPNIVINLAAQAGVRYSIENPSSYINANIVGFSNIIELSKKFKVEHLIYASSSSVYR